MKESVRSIWNIVGFSLLGLIAWGFGAKVALVFDGPYDMQMRTMSGEHYAKQLIGTESRESGLVPLFWTKSAVLSSDCPVTLTTSSHIDQVIMPIGSLLQTESVAVEAAKLDLASGRGRVYIPSSGSGNTVCALARSFRSRGIQVQLLSSRPNDLYGFRYIDAYNKKIIAMSGASG